MTDKQSDVSELVEHLDCLHVYPQSVADAFADKLGPKTIDGLYAVGTIAEEAATTIKALQERVVELEIELRECSKEFSRCLPGSGGSEWFKPIGDEFYLDAKLSADAIKDKLNEGSKNRVELFRVRKGIAKAKALEALAKAED